MGFIHSISQIKKKSTLSEEKVSSEIHESRKIAEEQNDKLNESITSLLERVKASGYGVTQEDVDTVLKAVKEGKLTDTEFTDKQRTLLSIKDTPENAEAIRNLYDEVYNENHGEKQRDSESIRNDYERYRNLSNNRGDDNFDVKEQDANGRSREVHGGESASDGIGHSRKSTRDNGGLNESITSLLEPDIVRNGIEFDYVEELLSNPNNIELQIKRRQPAGSATGEKHPNTSSELPSYNSISRTEEKSTLSEEKVSSKIRESRKIAEEQNDKLNESITSLLERVKASGYGVTQEDVDTVLKAVKEGKLADTEFTDKQRTLVSEVIAMKMEETFSDARSVERLVNDNPSLAKRIWERIKALVDSFRKSKEEKEQIKKLRQTEELFRKALENAGVEYIEGEIEKSATEGGENTENVSTVKHSFHGYADDGRGIYSANFPKGTPKAAKSERILDYIQNVWSKKPISLLISNGETSRSILARFDPTVDQSQNTPTDASKIAGGNRHGNHTEQRVTLDLADDYYQITSDAKYNYSKLETGKTSSTHSNVKMWHYFVNDIYFIESGEDTLTPYIVTINIKENNNGEFVYSYNAEKESPTRRTLHAGVNTYKGANGELFFDNSISQTEEKSTLSEEKVSSKIRESRKMPNENSVNRIDFADKKLYYEKRPKFIHKNFPGTEPWREAHRLAIWWANREDTIAGDQTLISMNDNWYLVEKFDDADNGYQVEAYVSKSEYKTILREVKEYGRSGKIKSIQRVFVGYDKLDKPNNTFEREQSSLNSYETGYGPKNQKMVRMVATEGNRGERTSSYRSRDSSSGGTDRQRNNLKEKHSRKENSDYSLSSEDKTSLSKEFGNLNSSKIGESRNKENENSANHIDNGRKIEYDVKKVDRKPPQLHQFTKQDEAVLRKRVMERNSSGKGLFPIDFAYTANHFVVYQNFGEDNYKKISTLDIDINKDIIAYIEKEIKNGRIYRTSPELRSDIVRFRSEHRRSSSNYDTATNARSNGRTGGLHRSQSTGNNEQSFGTSSDNISKVKHSRKINPFDYVVDGTSVRKVTLSPGQYAKFKANYHGEKTFDRNDIQNSILKIERIKKDIKGEARNTLIGSIFKGYNMRLDSNGYEKFSEILSHKLHTLILQESNTELTEDEIRELDDQILHALNEIVESGNYSIKSKLEYSVSKEGLKKQADYWRDEHDKALEQIKIRGRILNLAQKIKDLKTGAYVNASRYKSEAFKGTIEKLARIQFRGNMNVTGTRSIIGELRLR